MATPYVSLQKVTILFGRSRLLPAEVVAAEAKDVEFRPTPYSLQLSRALSLVRLKPDAHAGSPG